MYHFVDTEPNAEVALLLPSEAMSINGKYLENEIPGYRTLTVSGRELLETEVASIVVGTSNGSKKHMTRLPERIISVEFQLIAETNSAFREAFIKLNKLLQFEDAKLIFNDELDKFFIGTKSQVSSIPPGRNKIIASFEIICHDPLKYSVNETTIEAVMMGGVPSFIVDYQGTEPTFPKFSARTLDENGYFAFINDRGKILQFGEPDEQDTVNELRTVGTKVIGQQIVGVRIVGVRIIGTRVVGTAIIGVQQVQTIPSVNNGFTSWPTNSEPVRHHPTGVARNGALTTVVPSRQSHGMPANQVWLSLQSPGPGPGWWRGGVKTFVLPQNSDGTRGALNWYAWFCHRFICPADTRAMGFQLISFIGEGDRELYSITLEKVTSNNHTCLTKWRSNQNAVEHNIIHFDGRDQEHTNPYNTGRGANDILKEGNTIRFYWWGRYFTYTIPDALANQRVLKIQIALCQHEASAIGMTNMITAFSFTNRSVNITQPILENITENILENITAPITEIVYENVIVDIVNKFQPRDVLEIDTATGDVLHNFIPNPGLGARGNDWEDFQLVPGINQIRCAYSDWSKELPGFSISYREAFL